MTGLASSGSGEVGLGLALGGGAVVAGGAAGRDAGVIHLRTGECDGAFVACLAGGRGDDVRFRLPLGGGAVVAGGAAGRDAGMVHPGTGECRCVLMTGLARSGGLNMSSRLAPCIRVVMAADALANALRMIVTGVLECRTDMAAFAQICRRRMLDRLAYGDCAVMTSCAPLWCALETTVDVARCAVCGAMRTDQWEPCARMIKAAAAGALRHRRRSARQCNQEA